MAHFTGNPTWQDYPTASTPITAARMEALERIGDGANPLRQAGLRAGKLRLAKQEAITVAVNQSFTLANLAGPGSVQSIWMALGGGSGPCLDARLRVFYDGASTPDIDIDLGTLLAQGWDHRTPHVSFTKTSNHDTGFLITFPMPFGTSIRLEYLNVGTTAAALYSMIAYRLTAGDDAAGLRLRAAGARYSGQAITRTSNATNTILNVTGGPGWLVWFSYVGGVGATNLSWLERNIQIQTDAEAIPQIVSTGTEDWFDTAWYYFGWSDVSLSQYSYVGADKVAAPNQTVVGQATDFLGKWGGIPFDSSCVMSILPEPACTTGDTFSYAVLYYR
jgi:hypothetical protein